ncbi:hypothetical protein B0H94_11720 [Salsuginibacillus halophilus]|uniref:Uncharacterized protein n=1 Tax=Salsuginibacillus halophilus TaxID=517424 RepID=A0A2P8H7Q3_9BACI|nr:hypothetical protein [Salsuginibacillus halophilus]PSL42246.1 hypothetical protein B0H94_11720 [Salsuginibacillus halophilus]
MRLTIPLLVGVVLGFVIFGPIGSIFGVILAYIIFRLEEMNDHLRRIRETVEEKEQQ